MKMIMLKQKWLRIVMMMMADVGSRLRAGSGQMPDSRWVMAESFHNIFLLSATSDSHEAMVVLSFCNKAQMEYRMVTQDNRI